jgi:hypothetical protein
MKKSILVIAALAFSTMAFADMDCRWGIDHRHPACGPRGHYSHQGPTVVYRDNNNWVAPLVIGGIAGIIIANQNRQPEPVVVQQQPVLVQQQVYPPVGYHFQYILDEYCNCYKQAIVPN